MTGRVDSLRGQGRGPKICSSACKIYCRGNKTHYSLWLTLRVIKLFGDTENLQFEKELQRIFLKCTKFLNRSRFRTSHYGGRAKATCFLQAQKKLEGTGNVRLLARIIQFYWGCELGPEKAGTISGDRLVFRVLLLYCTRLRNTRHLKGRFKA